MTKQKRLRVARETIRQMTAPELEQVGGGKCLRTDELAKPSLCFTCTCPWPPPVRHEGAE